MLQHWLSWCVSIARPDSDSDSYTDSYEVNKGSTGTNSDGDSYSDSYGQLLWKLLKFHLIGTDISAKLGTVATGIEIGITIEIGVGSVETVLHIIILAIWIGIGVGIGVGQWKHTMTQCKQALMLQSISKYYA